VTINNIITNQHIPDELKARAITMCSTMTPAEARLWNHLRKNNLGGFHFRRQQIIHGYIVDFYCHTANLVIEVDGSEHLKQKNFDKNRVEFLNGLGIAVIRFYKSGVMNPVNSVFEVILENCRSNSIF
jgi:very-short-patch-repair endonuclease